MSLSPSKLHQILPFLPTEFHEKTKEIYNHIPMSLLKFLNPTETVKSAECREYGLRHDSFSLADQCEHWASICQEYNGPKPEKFSSRDKIDMSRLTSSIDVSTDKLDKPTRPRITYQHRQSIRCYEKQGNSLRIHLFKSIQRIFRDRNIVEVSPNIVADQIVRKCFEQCPDFGEKQCKKSSTIVRFNIIDLVEKETSLLNIIVFIYANLMYEYDRSFLPWKTVDQPKIGYDLTIELSTTAVDCATLIQYCELVAENDVLDAVKIIEETTPIIARSDSTKDWNSSMKRTHKVAWEGL